MKKDSSKAMMILAMTIFGTIGLFRRFIPMESSALAMVRGTIGTVFILLFMAATGRRPDKTAIQRNLVKLLVSGAMIGFNWILLFEAYSYTTVAIATLCYYMAPIFVMVLSPFALGEKLTGKKILSVLIALLGMVLVSGVLEGGVDGSSLKGILLGLGAAVLYALVVLTNKKLSPIDAYDKTVLQLGAAALAILPYTLLTKAFSTFEPTVPSVLLVLFVGIVHTGLAYTLYFGSMGGLSTTAIALFAYIDPIVAVLASAFLLKELMGPLEAAGIILVLGATFISELPSKRQRS